MKHIFPYLLTVLVGLGAYFLQQGRINELELKLTELQDNQKTAKTTDRSSSSSDFPIATAKSSSNTNVSPRIISKENDKDDTLKSFSEVMDNDAGRAMMKQGMAMAIPQLYGDFIKSLNLSEEEEQHFNSLLTDKLVTRQQLGMKWMQASDNDRKDISKHIQEAEQDGQQAIETFLNNKEDVESFKLYEKQLPERQSLSGIREAIAKTETPLTAEKEEELVSALYTARIESGTNSGDDSAIWQSIAEKGDTSGIKERWEKADATLEDSLSNILDPEQKEAFTTYWKQIREIQLMQYEMANRMMKRNTSSNNE